MTDLFDRVAMRVLGSQANLRPRRRTRFEPMIGSQPSSKTDQAAPWDIAPIEDDSLAVSEFIVEQAQAVAPRQTAKTIVSAADPHVSVPSSSAPLAQTGGLPADRHLPTSEEERPPTEPTARGQQAIAASSSAPRAEEATAQQASPSISKQATAPPPIVHPAVRRDAVAGGSTLRALHGDIDPPVERPATVNGSTSPVTIETVTIETAAVGAPIIAASARPVASAPTSRPPRPDVASENQTRTNVTPSSTPDAEPLLDPLGVRARSRIEQRPSEAHARPYLAPPLASPTPVEVTIGRLEIRAESASPAARPTRPFEPHLDLAAYRARKERGA